MKDDAAQHEHECRSWPLDQQARWCEAFQLHGIICSWKPATRRPRAYIWDLYLRHCLDHRLPQALTADGVGTFAKACKERDLVGRSFHNYAVALAAVAKIVDPDSNFIATLERLNGLATTKARQGPKRKTAVLATMPAADEIFSQLCDGLHEIGVELDSTPRDLLRNAPKRLSPERRRLIVYRRRLVTALLLACPERRGAFSQLLCSDISPDLMTIRYRSETTKPGTENVQPLPQALQPHLRRWLDLRGLFAPTHDRLWIQIEEDCGAPAGPDTIYRDVRAAMRELKGNAYPHLLRDLAATFARDELPQLPRLGSSVLNHTDQRTTAIYTEAAKDAGAFNAAQTAIAGVVDQAGQKTRTAQRGPSRAALNGSYRKRCSRS